MVEWKGKRVFVSGGAGVIGNELVSKLYNFGATVFVGDLEKRPKSWSDKIRYRQGDLNYIAQEELLDFNPEYFFHLAATFERSTETYDFWQENYHHNVRLSNHLMNCLKDSTDLKKVIFASSYLIYDPKLYNFTQSQQNAVRLKETDPIYPRNLCGAAKLMHEIELRFLDEFKAEKCEFVSARIFRSYGKNSQDIISRWIRLLLQNKELNVYRLEGIFDYIYAGEVAQGLLRLAGDSIKGVFNLGNDNARRVKDVLDVLKKYFPKMKTIHVASDISYEASQANMEFFEKAIGWKPARQLEDVIPEIIKHEKQHVKYNKKEESEVIFNVLVTSISKKVGLIKSVKRALEKLGVPGKIYGADCSNECIAKYFVDSFWQMPKLSELLIQDLIDFCVKENITAIIPTRDGELEFFAEYKDTLKTHGISVMVSNKNAILTCVDKLRFFEQTREFNFPVIQTVQNIDTLNVKQYVVKERFGAGSSKIGLNLTYEQSKTYAKQLQDPIFQPFIEGKEFSLDLYIDLNSKTKGTVIRQRDVVVQGESQITTVVKKQDLEKMCSEFAQKLGLYGHVVLQALEISDGSYHIIECNSRFGGASTLGLASGLDSFYWFFLECLGSNIDEYCFLPTKMIKRQVRFAEDLVIDGSSF